MTTTRKYNKSEIMKAAWADWKNDIANGDEEISSFKMCLKIAWRKAKEAMSVDTESLTSVAKVTNGSVWSNRIYFNGNFGAVYAEKIGETWTMGIKRSDITSFNGQMLNAMLDDKANELTNLGLTLR